MRIVLFAAVTLVAVAAGCSGVKEVTKVTKVIVKDVALEDQQALNNKYVGSYGWNRVVLEDLTEKPEGNEPKKRIVPIDAKVQIIDINYAYNGAVTVLDEKRRQIVHGLDIERPLTVEKIEQRLSEIFWFKSPMIRHVGYIRDWGKKTARAVMNHEVFVGMPVEAALESWGIPHQITYSELAGKDEQQWVYRTGKRNKYIYVIFPDSIVTKWEE